MTAPWQPIADALQEIYKAQNISRHFKKDEAYLKEAYAFTERLWTAQLEKTERLNVIMISESPLFGEMKKYLYNPHSVPTVFFYFKDLEALADEGEVIQKPENVVDQKQIMFNTFQKKGFITLDIFPFALNPDHTTLHYQNISKHLYKTLLEVTAETYLIPKLKRCLEKAHDNTHFVYRYKRLYEKTEHHFETQLNDITQGKLSYQINSVHKNMSLDREKLKQIIDRL